MSKKRGKQANKKRNLKYGQILKSGQVSAPQNKEAKEAAIGQDTGFKKEIRKNLLYVGIFTIFLILMVLVLTKTNVLEPLLILLGLKNIY